MLQELTASEIQWNMVEAPDGQELVAFVRNAGLTANDAEFVAQNYHRPEMTVREDYIMFLLQIPVFDKKLRITTGVPLYIVIRKDTVWTLNFEALPSLQQIYDDLSKNPEAQEEYFADGPAMVALYIISHLQQGTFTKLDKLRKHIEIAADAVFHGNERKMVEEIALLTRDVQDFRSVLRPQKDLFADTPSHSLLSEDTKEVSEVWRRIHNRSLRVWELLETMTDNIRELGKTNTSLLQHKENELLRLLTWYSIITIPVWIFVTPFTPLVGAGVPFQSALLYWGVLLILVLVLFFIFIRFRRKNVL